MVAKKIEKKLVQFRVGSDMYRWLEDLASVAGDVGPGPFCRRLATERVYEEIRARNGRLPLEAARQIKKERK